MARVDLIQLHSVGAFDDLDRRTATGGALEGAIRAREERLVAAIGVTGHGMKAPAVHLEALRRFRFDTVLTPYNYRLTRYPEFLHDFEALVEEVRAQDAGLMLIKAVARNLWRAGEEYRFATWYEPLEEQSAIDAAMAFTLGRREATGICTAGDVRLIPMQIEAEGRAGPSSDLDEQRVIVEPDRRNASSDAPGVSRRDIDDHDDGISRGLTLVAHDPAPVGGPGSRRDRVVTVGEYSQSGAVGVGHDEVIPQAQLGYRPLSSRALVDDLRPVGRPHGR